jgi:hypothetical protein
MKTEIVDGEIVCRIGGPNVFADLGLPNPEARLLKAQLMNAINTEIRIQAPNAEASGYVRQIKTAGALAHCERPRFRLFRGSAHRSSAPPWARRRDGGRRYGSGRRVAFSRLGAPPHITSR